MTTKMTLRECLASLNPHFMKFYEADGRKEGLTLTAEETTDVLDYLEYVQWYLGHQLSRPKPGLIERIRRVFTGY